MIGWIWRDRRRISMALVLHKESFVPMWNDYYFKRYYKISCLLFLHEEITDLLLEPYIRRRSPSRIYSNTSEEYMRALAENNIVYSMDNILELNAFYLEGFLNPLRGYLRNHEKTPHDYFLEHLMLSSMNLERKTLKLHYSWLQEPNVNQYTLRTIEDNTDFVDDNSVKKMISKEAPFFWEMELYPCLIQKYEKQPYVLEWNSIKEGRILQWIPRDVDYQMFAKAKVKARRKVRRMKKIFLITGRTYPYFFTSQSEIKLIDTEKTNAEGPSKIKEYTDIGITVKPPMDSKRPVKFSKLRRMMRFIFLLMFGLSFCLLFWGIFIHDPSFVNIVVDNPTDNVIAKIDDVITNEVIAKTDKPIPDKEFKEWDWSKARDPKQMFYWTIAMIIFGGTVSEIPDMTYKFLQWLIWYFFGGG